MQNQKEPENWKLQFFSACVVAVFLAIVLLVSSRSTTNPQPAPQLANERGLESDIPYSYLSDLFSREASEPLAPSGSSADEEGTRGDEFGTNPDLLPTFVNPLLNPTAELSAPKLHDVLTLGESFFIKWNTGAEEGPVRLKVFESAVSYCGYDQDCLSSLGAFVKNYTIGETPARSGVFEWQVGQITGQNEQLSPGKYFVRLETAEGQALGDSQSFAVVSKNEQLTLDVAVPYDPEQMPYEAEPLVFSTEGDLPYGIMWNSAPSIFYVDIFVRSQTCGSECREGSGLYQIAEAIPNGLVWGWYPGRGDIKGARIPAGDYELYIQDDHDGSIKSAARIFQLE